MEASQALPVLAFNEFAAAIGVSRRTLWRRIKDPSFPQPGWVGKIRAFTQADVVAAQEWAQRNAPADDEPAEEADLAALARIQQLWEGRRRPNEMQRQWLLEDYPVRAAVFDREFGVGAAASIRQT